MGPGSRPCSMPGRLRSYPWADVLHPYANSVRMAVATRMRCMLRSRAHWCPAGGRPACPANTYPNQAGGSCSACPANSESAAGATTCQCKPGFIGNGTGSSLECTRTSTLRAAACPTVAFLPLTQAERAGRTPCGGRAVLSMPSGRIFRAGVVYLPAYVRNVVGGVRRVQRAACLTRRLAWQARAAPRGSARGVRRRHLPGQQRRILHRYRHSNQ